MPRPARLLGLVVLASLTGCSDGRSAVEAGPVTPEAIIAIAGDHLDEPSSSRAGELDGSDPERSVVARLTYGDEHVDVVVGPARPETLEQACAEEGVVSCAPIDTDADGTLTLAWQELEPEEDPGIIVLVMERDGEFSMVRWGGDIRVTGDPRELDLEVPVDDAVELLEDERLRLEVS